MEGWADPILLDTSGYRRGSNKLLLPQSNYLALSCNVFSVSYN